MNYSQQFVVRWLECASAGAIILVATSLAVSRLRQPRDRINLILMAFFATIVIVPLATIVPFSTWHAGVFSSVERSETKPAPVPTATLTLPFTHRDLSSSGEHLGGAANQPATEFHIPTSERSSSLGTSGRWLDVWQIAAIGLVGSYGAAAALFLINWLVGARALQRLVDRGSPAEDVVNDLWIRLTKGRGGHVRVRTSAEIATPLAYRRRHPTILIPESIAAGDTTELRLCLAHEWAHVANNDLRTWWLAWICQFLLWFQPLYWKLRRELRVCQDVLADQQAAGEEGTRVEYSELLLKLARLQPAPSLAGAISFLDSSSHLARRVKMLLASPLVLRRRSSRTFWFAAAMCSLAGSCLIGSIRLDSARADDVNKTSAAQPVSAQQKSSTDGDANGSERTETKTVRGQVVDENGAPVEGAQLWLSLSYRPRCVAQTKSDKMGHFELKFPSAWVSPLITGSSWTIWAYAPNHSIATESAFEQVRRNSEKQVEIKLGAPSVTSFKVLSPARAPLAGALVQPQNYKTRAGYDLVPEEMVPVVSARTGSDGIAQLPAIQRGPLFRVQVVSDEFGDQSLRVDRDPETPTREILLRATGRIEGRLVGERPETFKGVQLTFSTDNQDEWVDTQGQATVTSDAEGKFIVPAIANGGPLHTYVEIEPSLPFRPRLKDDQFVVAGETLQLEIPFVAATIVSGKVLAKASGKPVEKAVIFLAYGGFHQSEQAVTDAEGKYEGRVLPGPLRAQCFSLPDNFEQLGEPWAKPFQVPPNVEKFELPPIEVVGTHSLSGRLVDDKDRPLAAMQVSAVNENRRYGFAETDSEGHFTMRVPDGVETEIVVFTDKRGQDAVDVVQKDPLVVRYSIDPHEDDFEKTRATKSDVILTGRVLSDGNPLAGVPISLSRGITVPFPQRAGKSPYGKQLAGRSTGMRMDHIAKTVTDTDGRFRLTGLKAGDSYQIEVKPSITAHDPAWQHQSPWMPKLPDNASGEVKLPDVKLIKLTQSLAGQVVDPDGKPVEGAQVSAMLHDGFQGVPRNSPSGPPTWTTTDQEGGFKLQQLPDEPLVLMAYINVHREKGGAIKYPARVNVERNQQDIRIVLDPSLVKDE